MDRLPLEIKRRIASCSTLSHHDLTSLATVDKSWQDAAERVLWSVLSDERLATTSTPSTSGTRLGPYRRGTPIPEGNTLTKQDEERVRLSTVLAKSWSQGLRSRPERFTYVKILHISVGRTIQCGLEALNDLLPHGAEHLEEVKVDYTDMASAPWMYGGFCRSLVDHLCRVPEFPRLRRLQIPVFDLRPLPSILSTAHRLETISLSFDDAQDDILGTRLTSQFRILVPAEWPPMPALRDMTVAIPSQALPFLALLVRKTMKLKRLTMTTFGELSPRFMSAMDLKALRTAPHLTYLCLRVEARGEINRGEINHLELLGRPPVDFAHLEELDLGSTLWKHLAETTISLPKLRKLLIDPPSRNPIEMSFYTPLLIRQIFERNLNLTLLGRLEDNFSITGRSYSSAHHNLLYVEQDWTKGRTEQSTDPESSEGCLGILDGMIMPEAGLQLMYSLVRQADDVSEHAELDRDLELPEDIWLRMEQIMIGRGAESQILEWIDVRILVENCLDALGPDDK